MFTQNSTSNSWNNLPIYTQYAIERAHHQGTLAPGSLQIMKYGSSNSSNSTNYDAGSITRSSGKTFCYNAYEGI